MSRRGRACALALIAATGLTACGRAPEHAAAVDGDLVLATFDSGTVTLADLDTHLAQTAGGLQWDADAGSPERLLEVIERIAIERITLAGPLRHDVPPAAVALRVREMERRAATRLALARAPLAPPTRADLAAFLATHRDRFERPERRRVYHIYKRLAANGSSRADVRNALESLRTRAREGENFGLLARAHSDSETRHRDGFLGEVARGHFSADFDKVVFGLDEGTISAPAFTADGGHLFFVADVLPAREPTVEGLGILLYRAWLEERQRSRAENLARELVEARG